MSALLRLLVTTFLYVSASAAGEGAPNILFVLIDDLGWNDVSYHGGSDFDTPYLDALAEESLLLNNYYVQHFCTPTRHALMSGRYPMRDGMQQWVIRSSSGYGMPLEITTLPQELKNAGYSTHLLGKWHLGFFDPDYTPTFRGFDTFMGYYGDKEEYYMKNNSEWAVFQNLPVDESLQRISGFDFRDGVTPWVSEQYSTYLYRDQTLQLMADHVADDDADPFFILLSSQAPHTPYDAPDEAFDRFNYIEDDDRSELAAVLSVLDETLGDIVAYLKSDESGHLWDDTMVIVSSDNGGTVTDGASNFPLRGGKKTLWEGGIKATAFITGGWLPDSRRGQECDALMHVTDWLPTLCSICGVEPSESALDGYDQSTNIFNGEMDIYHPREEILHHVIMHEQTETDGSSSSCYNDFCGAIRWRNYKLVVGKDNVMTYSEDDCLNWWCENAKRDEQLSSHSIQCHEKGNYVYPQATGDFCLFTTGFCLFDLTTDPCEYSDVHSANTEIVEQLMRKLHDYNATQAFPLFREYPENATLANPNQFGGFWSPWQNRIDSPSDDDNEEEEAAPETPQMEGPDQAQDDAKQHDADQKRDHEKQYAPEHEEHDEHESQRREQGYAPQHEEEGGHDDHEGEHGDHDHVLASKSLNVNYTMNGHMMMFVVFAFAVAAMVQLYNCYGTDYKRIADDHDTTMDGLRISA